MLAIKDSTSITVFHSFFFLVVVVVVFCAEQNVQHASEPLQSEKQPDVFLSRGSPDCAGLY